MQRKHVDASSWMLGEEDACGRPGAKGRPGASTSVDGWPRTGGADEAAVAVVIPAYQPDSHLIEVVHEVKELGFLAVVVDDGSSSGPDGSWEGVEHDAALVHHDRNYGKGHALRTGLAYVRDHMAQAAYVVTMDGDGQHLVPDMLAVLGAAKRHRGALVIGSRALGQGAPLRSRLGGEAARVALRCLSGSSIADTQSGLRAFAQSLIPLMLSIEGERYEYEANVLLRCAGGGVPVIEVPISTVYHDASNSCSHYRRFADTARIAASMARFAASSLASFALDFGLFALLLALLGNSPAGIASAAVCARLVSASVNYLINRALVFHSSRSHLETLPAYAALAVGILALNMSCMLVLTQVVGIDPLVAKVATEASLFALSFIVQRLRVFPNDAEKGAAPGIEAGREASPATALPAPERTSSSRVFISRRGVLAMAGLGVLDMALAGGVVGADYVASYLVPHSLGSASATTAAASGAGTAAAPWGKKFADRFSQQTVQDGTTYKSPHISVALTCASRDSGTLDRSAGGKHEQYGTCINYVLADIYVDSIECMRTSFAWDVYGVGYSESMLDMAARTGAVLAVNGDSYSNNRHRKNGTIIRNGQVYRTQPATDETCVLFRDGTMATYMPDELDPEQLVADGAWQSWVFGPSLLDSNGKAKTSFYTWDYIRQSHPRTAIGYFEPGHYCLLTVDGRQKSSRGMYLEEMAALFEEMGCRLAYNLDGGSSSFMTFGGQVVNRPYSPLHRVSDGIVLCEPGSSSSAAPRVDQGGGSVQVVASAKGARV